MFVYDRIGRIKLQLLPDDTALFDFNAELGFARETFDSVDGICEKREEVVARIFYLDS